MEEYYADTEEEMLQLGAKLAGGWKAGFTVLLSGDLGAGKTTLVRGALQALGWNGAVRSPTFNLMVPYDTEPPVLHADFYRLDSAAGTGIEEYLGRDLCLIEWPDRLGEIIHPDDCIRIDITFSGNGRNVRVISPPRLQSGSTH